MVNWSEISSGSISYAVYYLAAENKRSKSEIGKPRLEDKRGLRRLAREARGWSGGLLLKLRRPFAHRGQPVHRRAMGEGRLRGSDVFRFAGPRLLRRSLERAAIGEGYLPRGASQPVHSIEPRGGVKVGFPPGEELRGRHRGRPALPQPPQSLLRGLIDRGLLRAFLARDHHVGLEHHAFELHPGEIELVKQRLQRKLGDLVAAVGVVIAVHEHLWLDDGDEI